MGREHGDRGDRYGEPEDRYGEREGWRRRHVAREDEDRRRRQVDREDHFGEREDRRRRQVDHEDRYGEPEDRRRRQIDREDRYGEREDRKHSGKLSRQHEGHEEGDRLVDRGRSRGEHYQDHENRGQDRHRRDSAPVLVSFLDRVPTQY